MTSEIPDCGYLIGQFVMSPLGKGEVQGVYRDNGCWQVIVKFGEDVRPGDVIPTPQNFTLYHFEESLLSPVVE